MLHFISYLVLHYIRLHITFLVTFPVIFHLWKSAELSRKAYSVIKSALLSGVRDVTADLFHHPTHKELFITVHELRSIRKNGSVTITVSPLP